MNAMNDLAGNDKQYKCRALVHLQLCKTAVENVTCIITKASSGQFPFLEFPFEFHGYVHLIQCISEEKKNAHKIRKIKGKKGKKKKTER